MYLLNKAKIESFSAENTDRQGKYHCTADLLSRWIGFDQPSKSVIIQQKKKSRSQTGGQL